MVSVVISLFLCDIGYRVGLSTFANHAMLVTFCYSTCGYGLFKGIEFFGL